MGLDGDSPGSVMSTRGPTAAIHRRYLTALACIAALILLDRVQLQPELSRLSTAAPVINIAGRQRMLSQQLAKTAVVLAQETNPVIQDLQRPELLRVVDEWSRAHVGLQHGDPERSLPGGNSRQIAQGFDRLTPHFEAMRAAAVELASDTTLDSASQRRLVDTILQHEPQYLSQMHDLVALFEAEVRSRVALLQQSVWVLALATLAIMAILYVLAIRPAGQQLEQQFAATADQYAAVVESITEGLLLLDHQGRIQFANRQFSELVQIPTDELTGRVAATLFRGPMGHLWPQPFAAPDHSALTSSELELLRADRSTRLCRVLPYRLTIDERFAHGWVILVIDITAERAAELRSQALADQLAHADRLKSMGEIAAGLAHEVHQPLGAIANFAEGCLARLKTGQASPAELEAPLQRILAAALRAGGIIRRVRSFSQHRPHTLAPIDVNQLIEEALELYRVELQRRQVQCFVELEPHLPAVQGDALQISQVLTNLIQNATQAMESTTTAASSLSASLASPLTPATAVRELRLTSRLVTDQHVEIIVEDNGPGIAAELLDHLFEPFSTTRLDGLGMGLSIARSIVAAHGGTLTAENRPQQGARMTIQLPLTPPREPPGAQQRPQASVTPAGHLP